MNNLIERDRNWDRDYNKLQERLGRQRADLTDQARWIEVLQGEVSELNEARMLMETQVMGMEDRLCRCGTRSVVGGEEVEYVTPNETSPSSPFQGASPAGPSSPEPLPIREPPMPPADQSLPASDLESSAKENCCPRAREPAPILMELVPIVEDRAGDTDAEMLSDQMDEVRRAVLCQRAKRGRAKRGPYTGVFRGRRHRGRDLPSERERRKTTRQLIQGGDDADHESSSDSSVSPRRPRRTPNIEPRIRYMGCDWKPNEFFGLGLAVPT